MARIAVIGAGAVGCYYGARLAQHGHEVHFVLRRDLRAAREHGLDVRSPDGDFCLSPVHAHGTADEIGPVDWAICALKSTALDHAPALLAPVVGPQTRIVALMNGLGIEDSLAAAFPANQVFGAMAFVCINRGEPGVIHHLKYGRLSIGHRGDDASELALLDDLLRSGGLDVVSAPNLRYARWEKLCWNVPFNGLSVAAGGLGTESILGDDLLRATAERAMREVVEAGNADLAALRSAARLDAEEIVSRLFALTETMGDYRTSMVIDYLEALPLEVETILGNPVRRAEELGVAVPTMAALYTLVRAADRQRRGLMATLGGA